MDIEALERREIRRKQMMVAGLFVLALLLAMVFAYWMGALGLGPTRHVFVDYNFAGGLDRGSTVRLAGIKVGRVSDIQFLKNPGNGTESTNLKLKLELSPQALEQLTEDTQFYINLAGLIGERYVEVVPGHGATVKPGFEFRGIDPPRVDQLISQGYGIFGDMRTFFKENKGDLREMFMTLNELSKSLNTLMSHWSPDQKKQVNLLLENFAAMSTDLRQFAHSMSVATTYMGESGAKESWTTLQALLAKANKIGINDLRRLMLEDGVKVNFTSKKVVDLPPEVKAGAAAQMKAEAK